MFKFKGKIRAGTLGWSMGDAFKVLQTVHSRYGKGYVVEIVRFDQKNKKQKRNMPVERVLVRKANWVEFISDSHIRRDWCPGPDCNGDLPPKHLFSIRPNLVSK